MTELDYYYQALDRVAAKLGEPVEPVSDEVNLRLQEFNRTISGSTFQYAIGFDITKQAMFNVLNYGKVLGYSETGLNYEQYCSNIPSPEREGYILSASHSWPTIMEYVESGGNIVPFHGLYGIRYPLRHKNGLLLEIQQSTMPIQLDAKGYMVRYLSIYTVIGELQEKDRKNQQLNLLIRDNNLKRASGVEGKITRLNNSFFNSPFSPKQQEILKIIADGSYPISISLLAKKMGIRRDTLNEYIHKGATSIFAKAEAHSQIRFHTIYQIAEYYRGLLLI